MSFMSRNPRSVLWTPSNEAVLKRDRASHNFHSHKVRMYCTCGEFPFSIRSRTINECKPSSPNIGKFLKGTTVFDFHSIQGIRIPILFEGRRFRSQFPWFMASAQSDSGSSVSIGRTRARSASSFIYLSSIPSLFSA